MTPFLFWFFGLLFVLLEFYLPGAILGTIGAIFLISSIVLFAMQSSSPIFIILFTVGVIVSVILLIKQTLKHIVQAKPDYSIYSTKDQEGYVASSFDGQAIGKKGIVVADLKPGGYILIEGKKLAAISQSGYLPKGAKVLVIGGDADNLFVRGID